MGSSSVCLLGEVCPSATLSTPYPLWIGLGSNRDLNGGRPASSCLSNGRT